MICVLANAAPTVPATAGDTGNAGVVDMAGGPADATLILSTLVTTNDGLEVVAPIVTENAPLVVGVPVIWPVEVLNDRPGTTLPKGLGLTV